MTSAITTQLMLVSKLFILMGVGLVCARRGIIADRGKGLTELVLRLVLPANIIYAFMTGIGTIEVAQVVRIIGISLSLQLLSYFLAHVLYRRCEEDHQPVLKYATLVPNSGTLGTAIATELFGAAGAALASIYLIAVRTTMWTLGLSFFTKKLGNTSIKKVLTHPCIASVFLGAAIMVVNPPIPALVTECIKTIGGCNTALSMMLVGCIASEMDPKLLYNKEVLYFSFVRLLAIPATVFLFTTLIGADELTRNVSVVLSAMPAASTTSVLAMKYDADTQFASSCVTVTAVLSLAALPVWCLLLM